MSVAEIDGAMFVDPALCTPTPTAVDAYERPDETAAALAVLAPDGDDLTALLRLIPSRLSDTGLIDALMASERQLAGIAAHQQQLLAEVARRDPDGELYLRDEVACAVKVAPATAEQKLDIAEALTGRLTDTLTQVERGDLSYTHGRILATATRELDDPVTAKVQGRVLRRAAGQTPGEFRAAVRRAVARFDRRDQNSRHAVAFADRKVISYPDEDGMASIWLHLAADGAATVMTAINARARRAKEAQDGRTADQRRADAAVDICLAALDNPDLPTQHGLRPAVSITIAETTLTGQDDQPAELDGYGPIPADLGRRIATQPGAVVRHWLVDTEGRLLDEQPTSATGPTTAATTTLAGTTRYEPTTRIARQVITRDQFCVHPGCRRKAITCQLDHRVPWPEGATSVDNIQALCRRHHDLKHHSRWRVRKRDGSYHWTSPTGHTYRYRPPELPVPIRETEEVADQPPPF